MFQLEQAAPDVAVITINDPKKGANILSRAALAAFDELLSGLEKRKDLAGLIVRSTKPGNFIAGADLREFVADLDKPAKDVAAVSQLGQQLFARLSRAPFVTIAAIDGICVGGGSELAIWCDRRLMVDNEATSFGFPEVKLGLLPGWGGTARTPRIIGLSNAVELITSGEPIDAKAAYAMGLADVAPSSGAGLKSAEGASASPSEQSKIQNPKSTPCSKPRCGLFARSSNRKGTWPIASCGRGRLQSATRSSAFSAPRPAPTSKAKPRATTLPRSPRSRR